MLFKFGLNYFLFFSTIAVIAPYLQVILKAKGFSPAGIGLLLGFYELSGIAGPLLAGWIAEKIGRYRLLMLVFSLAVGGLLFFLGLSSSFVCAGFSLVLFGIFYRPIPSLQDALASRVLHNPVKSYGNVRIWGSIGFVFISLVLQFTGFLDVTSSFRIVLVFSVFAFFLFLSTLMLPEVHQVYEQSEKKNEHSVLQNGNFSHLFSGLTLPFLLALITVFFIKIGLSGYYSFFSLFLQNTYHLQSVSGIWAIGALAEIPMILWGSRLVTRFGPSSMLILSVIGASLRLFIYASGLPLPVILAAQLLHAFSFGLIHITMISIINHTIRPQRRAFAMSLYGGIGFGLAGFIGSSVSGYVLQKLGFTALYIFSGSITLVPLIPVFLFRKSISVEALR